jgi:hypothetical protein
MTWAGPMLDWATHKAQTHVGLVVPVLSVCQLQTCGDDGACDGAGRDAGRGDASCFGGHDDGRSDGHGERCQGQSGEGGDLGHGGDAALDSVGATAAQEVEQELVWLSRAPV